MRANIRCLLLLHIHTVEKYFGLAKNGQALYENGAIHATVYPKFSSLALQILTIIPVRRRRVYFRGLRALVVVSEFVQ